MANKITVTSAGTTANVNATPDSARYYSDKSKEWAISEKLIDNEDYSSKYYANESKKQADISTAKTTEVVESGNTAVSNIESARDNAITNITNQENVSVDNVNTAGATQVANVNSAGTTQVNLAKEQVTLATNKANIATQQATIATSQASIATSKTTEVVESGNTALSNIETAKSNALNDINTTGAEYVNNAKQYAQNALNSANSSALSESNALSYKKSAQESSQTATQQASIAVTNANKAATSATNAKTSEINAKSSETRCEEILSRLGTTIKIKGRVNSLDDLPLSGNLDGDTYLIGEEGLDSYPEYYWYQDHWEFLGTSGTSLSWGLISGNIAAQTDLQTALDSKQNKGNYALKSEIPTKVSQLTNDSGFINNDSTFVHKTGNETVAGVKTFSSTPVITSGNINLKATIDGTVQYNGTNFLRRANGGAIVLSGTNGAYIRPNGDANTTGQLFVATDGTVTGTKFVGNVTGNVSGSSGSCTGNSATATKATQDGNGNNIVNTYATKTSLNTKANTSLSNLTEAGLKVIKDNSGSGLEVCDIGMALYVDETKGLRRYLNGQIVDINTNTQAFLNRLKKITTLHPSLLCTEEEWQTAKTMSAFGQVGKFVFNYSGDEIVSVRIPRVVNIQGLFNLQNLGMTVSAGLPNITGGFTSRGIENINMNGWGAFRGQDSGDGLSYGHDKGKGGGFNFDASRSSSIYKDDCKTVQQEAIQYPYFIQIATGQETENNIVNDIELNNPFFFGMSQYFEVEPNNISWLKSAGQWNSKAAYPDYYNWILVNANKGKANFIGLNMYGWGSSDMYYLTSTLNVEVGSIAYGGTSKSAVAVITEVNKEAGTITIYNPSQNKYEENLPRYTVQDQSSSEFISDYDWVINSAEETFRLPIKVKLASGKAVVGNGMTLGFTDGSQTGGLAHVANVGLDVRSNYGSNIGTSASSTAFSGSTTVGLTTDPTKSGIETSDSDLYLYYYVGETVQNANLVDAGRIGEILPTKTDMQQAAKASMPSDRFVDLTLGPSSSTYTAPADGWFQCACEGTAGSTFFELVHPNISCCASYNGGWGRASMPVTKGMVISIYYGGNNFTKRLFRFTYAEGAQ